MLDFCYDKLTTGTIGYPNLAKHQADPYTPTWWEFDKYWPRTVPLRLIMYLDMYGVDYRTHTVMDAPKGSLYPIGIGWFNFKCDYFELISIIAKQRAALKEIKFLFYYHEGDNPADIKRYLDELCVKHVMPKNCYILISANTYADELDNCLYFSDHEFYFRCVNQTQPATLNTDMPRQYHFTLLSRTHKWWRASCVADLKTSGLLDHSLWSYNTECNIDDSEENNPLKLYVKDNWKENTIEFVKNGPYWCDSPDPIAHNNHHNVNVDLYTKSYCHLVMETHFDVDQSPGTFLTEKTWKAVKFGQPFIIIGGPNSLEQLKKDGYRTFDHVIDSQYDSMTYHNRRWAAIAHEVSRLDQQPNWSWWFSQCINDIKHNQQLFASRGESALNTFIGNLKCKI